MSAVRRLALLASSIAACAPPPPAGPASPAAPAAAAATPAVPSTPAPPAATAPTPATTAPGAAATLQSPVLKAIDVYGTERIDLPRLKAELGDKLERLIAIDDEAAFKELRTELTDEIRAKYRELGWVAISPITYFRPAGLEAYITIDAVETADMARRFRFRPAPTGDLADPAGLLAAWDEYEALFFKMMRNREITPQRVECPAFHCIGGYEHEKLKPFGERFVRDVPANEAALIHVLKDDKDPQKRGAAAYLLAHIKDGKKLVALLLPALDDPGPLVRNNATRVLSDIAHHHPEIAVPLEPVLRLLDGPSTTDRNKACAVLDGLMSRPGASKLHRQVVKQAGPTLLKLLALEQPNNHDFAYAILKQVTGQDLGERDVAAWSHWLAQQR